MTISTEAWSDISWECHLWVILVIKFISSGQGCHEGGAGGCSGPPLESELSFICIGFSLINDVRARVWPPPGKGGPPLENFLVTPMGGGPTSNQNVQFFYVPKCLGRVGVRWEWDNMSHNSVFLRHPLVILHFNWSKTENIESNVHWV